MAFLQTLMSLVNGRLSAAAEEICGTVGRILTEYEDEAFYLKQEIYRKSRLLDMALKENINSHRADILQQWGRNSIVVQGEPEPPRIKEERGEKRIKQEEGLIILAVIIGDDVENRETVPVANTSTGHMTAQGDSEDCGKSQPTSDDQISSHCSESDTEDSDGWELSRDDQSALNKLESPKTQNVEGQRVSHTISLLSHTMTHTAEKYFTCSLCDKGFVRTCDLKLHMGTHTKPFECKVCGKGCSQRGHLMSHMGTHTGERNFSCTVCGKGFSRMAGLKVHMRTHTGEKPFTCTVCSKGFGKIDYLKSHMRTHTGERPFVCTVCGKGCTQRGNLMSHMMTHTGGQNI